MWGPDTLLNVGKRDLFTSAVSVICPDTLLNVGKRDKVEDEKMDENVLIPY